MPEGNLAWGYRMKMLQSAGVTIILDGDGEGLAQFDPTDKIQAKAAIKAVGAYRKRQMTEEQKRVAVERLRQYRFQKNGEAA